MANKIKFAKNCQEANTTVAQLFLLTKDLDGVYFDEGFNDVGSDPIIDDDLTSLGITAVELALGITLFQQIQNLRNNDSVDPGDYQATVNALRADLNE